jgi:glycosyltransferase involved in cell wall biosynthesis
VARLAALLRHEHADLVHTNSLFALYGGWAATAARLPHVWHIREIPDVPNQLRRGLALLALATSSRTVAMTRAVAQQFPQHARASRKLVVLHDGIDLERFHPSVSGNRIRAELDVRADSPLVGFVARLDPWKGAEVFVQAAALVIEKRRDSQFIVCGGPLAGYEAYADGLGHLARQLRLNERIRFTNWRYRLDDIPEVMAALDVFVHTSIRPEPFGLVLVEAMGAAKPVVAANDGGVPEVVDAGVTGLLTPPGDAAACANAVLRLLDEPTTALTMGRAGRKRAERLFEIRGYAQRVQSLYDEVLAERSSG